MFVITPALLATTIACALPVQAARLPTIAAAADAVTAWELSAAAAAARSAANRAPATMFRAPSLPQSSSQQLQVRVTSLHCRMSRRLWTVHLCNAHNHFTALPACSALCHKDIQTGTAGSCSMGGCRASVLHEVELELAAGSLQKAAVACTVVRRARCGDAGWRVGVCCCRRPPRCLAALQRDACSRQRCGGSSRPRTLFASCTGFRRVNGGASVPAQPHTTLPREPPLARRRLRQMRFRPHRSCWDIQPTTFRSSKLLFYGCSLFRLCIAPPLPAAQCGSEPLLRKAAPGLPRVGGPCSLHSSPEPSPHPSLAQLGIERAQPAQFHAARLLRTLVSAGGSARSGLQGTEALVKPTTKPRTPHALCLQAKSTAKAAAAAAAAVKDGGGAPVSPLRLKPLPAPAGAAAARAPG